MIKFGPSGNSQSFFDAGLKHSEDSAAFVKNMGLDCFEYSFGRGVNMGDAKALSVGDAFRRAGVEISVHAPYFINLAGESDGVEKSFDYILSSARTGKLMGANRVVFHPASQGKLERGEAVSRCKQNLEILTEKIYEHGFDDMLFCPETMGKQRQIGTAEEIAEFCKTDKVFVPCIDFGHVNAREGGSLKSTEDFKRLLSFMISELGFERMERFHTHFSKIQYAAGGEVRHLTFEDEIYGPDYRQFALAVKSLGLKPYVICESAGTQAEDALKIKEFYEKN
ncbi:MAG: endonuclease IV [Bacillota bacterium]|nr:MAG: endonuclease IV [Bacillota bacterium]